MSELDDLIPGRLNKYITTAAYREAIATPLNVVAPSGNNDPLGAPYFLDLVGDELQSIDQREDGAKNIYTTIDLNLQRAAGEENALRYGHLLSVINYWNGTAPAPWSR